ncbi:phage holin, LLH family [Paenibacillus kandeliae]|uniref:phage holin, LLH family n=1 Tax=Paenibacillus kandeliae TaxID=3231269 RepID=UPI003459F68B
MIINGLKTVLAKVNDSLEARTTAAQRETIHKVAGEAFALAQTAFKELGGEAKMKKALDYVLKQLGQKGISISVQEYKQLLKKYT